jgi:hypothetical protein
MHAWRTRLTGLSALLLTLAIVGTPSRPLEAAPSFSVTAASVTPNPVRPGTTATITIGVKNSGSLASGIIVDMEVYDSANRKVFQQYIPGQTFGTGETKAYDWFWTVPTAQPEGTYVVKVGVFADHWTALYMWNNGATTFAVQTGPSLPVAFDVSGIRATPTSISRGGTVGITATVTNTGQGQASGIIIMLYLRDPLGNEFPGNQQYITNQSFAPGQARTLSFQWTAPAGAVQGVYSASIGVFDASWSQMYVWETNDSAFSVGTATEPTFAVGTTTVTPNPVARGQSFTITTTITNTSQVPAASIIVLAEYNDPTRNISQQYVDGLTFAAGQRRSISFVFTVPANLPPGQYTVDIGVFNGSWSKMYVWGYKKATFTIQ